MLRTIGQLKTSGFSVAPALEGCTRLSTPSPFFYFNPRFTSSAVDIARHLTAAVQVDGQYQLLLAGKHLSDHQVLPFAIVSVQQQQKLDKALQAYEKLLHQAEDARQALVTMADEELLGPLQAVLRP